MTTEQILNAQGDGLSKLAGEMLQPVDPRFSCYGCVGKKEGWCDLKEPCTEPYNPIPLTWDSAMRWRGWAVEKFGESRYEEQLHEVYLAADNGHCVTSHDIWLSCYIQPEHYIKAAMLCEIGGKK